MRQLFFLSLLLTSIVAAEPMQSALTYANSDFNQLAPGWSDTLTLTNNSEQPITIVKLGFDTSYAALHTSELNGTIYHPQQDAEAQQQAPYYYHYEFSTESPWSKGSYTIIPAHGSVNLTNIPIVHTASSQNGVPVYYRLPFNVQVKLATGESITVPLAGMCTDAACNDPAPGKMSGAYFTNWANYHYSTSPKNLLMPNQIPIKNLNTIFYDVAKIDRNSADISFTDINHDQNYLPAFDTLRQQYPYLNVIYSFGGWGDDGAQSYPSYDLAAIFDTQNPALIAKLANNMVGTMQILGFNGIDIDYEWNAIQPCGTQMQLTPERAQGFLLLLQDLRQALNALPGNYKLTAAVFSGPDKVEELLTNLHDPQGWQKIAAALDYLDIMAYDMHGQFDLSQTEPDNRTDFQSQMAVDKNHSPVSKILQSYSVTDAVNAYQQAGVPAAKIVVGIPAYGRIEKTATAITDGNKGLYQTLAADQPLGESGSGGTTDYKCIVDNSYCWNNFGFDRTSLVQVPAVFSGQDLGAAAQTPWAYDISKNWFMSYDDGPSAKNKANYVKSHNLAGVMIWEIDGDIPQTDVNYQALSVTYNAWLGLVNS